MTQAEQRQTESKPTEERAEDGYTCGTCNTYHEYPFYVYAHHEETLIHTCGCGSRYSICSGVATEYK